MTREDGFPLFLLDMVLLPSEQTVLHVFEDRYKELADRCIEEGRQFGLVYTDEEEPNEFACATHIDRVLERFDDGRMNVLVTGIEPIRIVEFEDRFNYPSAVVERLADTVGEDQADSDQLLRTRSAYSLLVEAVTDEPPDESELDLLGAYGMASKINLDETDKQLLLETRDENVRLSSLEEIFTTGAQTVAETRELARRAKGNGHGRYPRNIEPPEGE
jgi:ATP-dependent Lon protease